MIINRKPQISIIIPTWNTADITLKCVKSIRNYFSPQQIEIIVVDNFSTDNTAKKFSSLSDIKYLQLDQNYGYSYACNRGADQATSQVFLFLNSDMELVDNKLLQMLKFLLETPKCGLVGPKLLNTDLTPQGSVFPPQTPLNAFKQFWLRKPTYLKYSPITKEPISVWSISGGAVLIKKTLFQKLFGWNEHYSFYFEDMDLCRRIRALGLNIFYFPDCQIIHQHGTSAKQLTGVNASYKKLVSGSIKYYGVFIHYLINFVIWSGQKWYRFLSKIHLFRDQNR